MEEQVEVLVKDIVGRLYPVDDWRRNNLHIGPYYDESVVFSTIARLREIGYVVSSYFSFTSLKLGNIFENPELLGEV